MSSPIDKDKIKAQYSLEISLAAQLRDSSREQRKTLYGSLYDRYLAVYPDAFIPGQDAAKEIGCIEKFLTPQTRFLEIGPGDGHFSNELLKHSKNITTIEIGEEAVSQSVDGINQLFFNGVEMNLPADSFDVVYSNQVLEHIHTDDIAEHLRSIKDALVTDGRYVAITPHRYCGPHDISRHFDKTATGWHMHEYTYQELIALGSQAGYSYSHAYYQRNRYSIKLSNRAVLMIEKTLSSLPYFLKKFLGRIFLPSIMMVFQK